MVDAGGDGLQTRFFREPHNIPGLGGCSEIDLSDGTQQQRIAHRAANGTGFEAFTVETGENGLSFWLPEPVRLRDA